MRATGVALLLAIMATVGCVAEPPAESAAPRNVHAAEAGTDHAQPTPGTIVSVSRRGGAVRMVCVDFQPLQSPLKAERCLRVTEGTRVDKGTLASKPSHLSTGQEVDVWQDMTIIWQPDPPQTIATRIRIRA